MCKGVDGNALRYGGRGCGDKRVKYVDGSGEVCGVMKQVAGAVSASLNAMGLSNQFTVDLDSVVEDEERLVIKERKTLTIPA